MAIKNFFVLFWLLLINYNYAFSQKNTNLIVSFGDSSISNKIKFEFDDGVSSSVLDIKKTANIFIIKKKYKSKFAVLKILFYYSKDSIIANSYFINNKKAYLIFKSKDLWNSNRVESLNVLDVNTNGYNAFYTFAQEEYKEFEKLSKENNYNFTKNDSIAKLAESLWDKVTAKRLQFIIDNPELYYSIWIFKRDLASNSKYEADSLLKIAKNTFSKSFSKSFEYLEIVKILQGRLNAIKFKKIPIFKSTDINGESITSQKLEGKFIIIDFWASWCKPCIEEIQTLRSFYSKYKNDKLLFISVTNDKAVSKIKKMIISNGMSWTNIIDNGEILNAFGNPSSLPQTFLINPDGIIIYSRNEDEDAGLEKLEIIIQKIYTRYK